MENKLKALAQQGYSRIKIESRVLRIDEIKGKSIPKSSMLVIDRIITKDDEDFYNRLADASQIAFFEGKGELHIERVLDATSREFNNRFEADGITFVEPNVHLFSFN